MKKTMGKRRISIEKISDRGKLHVAFSKRRSGLFKKAASLSVLCGSNMVILVSNPSNSRVFSFGNPNPEAVIDAFVTGKSISEPEIVEIGGVESSESSDWWMSSVEELGVSEIEEYIDSIDVLRNNVVNRADELAMAARDFAMPSREENFCSSIEADASSSGLSFLGFDEEDQTGIGGIDDDVGAMNWSDFNDLQRFDFNDLQRSDYSDLDSIFVAVFEEYGFNFR